MTTYRSVRAVERAELAERSLAAGQARAVANERLRVAQDLTDLVAHNLTTVVIHAAAARRQAGGTLSERLRPVEEASRSALGNLRSLLELLKSTDDPALAPAPGLDQLVSLVETHQRAHGPARLAVDPEIDTESQSVRLLIYRLVQEALANVGRHAPGASADITIRLTDDCVEVVVQDDGNGEDPGPAHRPGGGFGLIGMRERVSLHGGRLHADAVPTGGFLVVAELERQPA